MEQHPLYSISRLLRYLLCLRCLLGESVPSASSRRSLSRPGCGTLPSLSALLLARIGGMSMTCFMKAASTLLTALLCFLRLPAQPPSLLECLPVWKSGL